MSNPIFQVELPLFFRGSRDYIYAADIFALSTKAILKKYDIEDLEKIDFSVHKMTDMGLDLFIYDSPVEVDGYCAKLNFTINSESYFGVLIENLTKVTSSVPYDEKFITEKSSIDFEQKSVELREKLNLPYLDVCTALNKYMHENVFKEIQGKWVSVRIQLDTFSEKENVENVEVKNRKVFGNKYTQNTIFLNGNKRGFIYFSII